MSVLRTTLDDDRGNSGGPLYDCDTHRVLGIIGGAGAAGHPASTSEGHITYDLCLNVGAQECKVQRYARTGLPSCSPSIRTLCVGDLTATEINTGCWRTTTYVDVAKASQAGPIDPNAGFLHSSSSIGQPLSGLVDYLARPVVESHAQRRW